MMYLRGKEKRQWDEAPINTKRDCRQALKEIEGLMDARRGAPEGDRLDVLVTPVEAWEARNYPLDLADPVAAITCHMEQQGLAPKDLVPYIGSRKRPLTLKMVWRLHNGRGIPAEFLIRLSERQAA